MRMAVSLEDGLDLDGDWCMRDTPTVLACFSSTCDLDLLHRRDIGGIEWNRHCFMDS